MPPQSLAGIDATASNAWRDAPSPQGATEIGGVVSFVSVELGRTLPRTARPPSWAEDRGNRVDEREQLGGVVRVGRREANRQRDAIAIHRQVVLAAWLAAVDGV